jgi:hypothetical protein
MPNKYQRAYACATGSSCGNGSYGQEEEARRERYDYGGESNIGRAAGALATGNPILKAMESTARRSREGE